MGYLPGVYLEEVKRKPVQQLTEDGRLNTLTSVLGKQSGDSSSSDESSRANSLRVEARKGGVPKKEESW